MTRASIYNGHLREPVTLTPAAKRLAVGLPLSVLKAKVCRVRDFENPTFRITVERSKQLRHHRDQPSYDRNIADMASNTR